MDLTTIILAGGGSRRFGAEKPLIELAGRTMIEWVLKEVEDISTEIIVVASQKNFEKISELLGDIRILSDEKPGLGPIGGICTGLKRARYPTSLVVPCDTPFCSGDLLKFLARSLSGHQAVVPRWPNGYIESLHVALETDASTLAAIDASCSGSFEVRGLFDRLSDVLFLDVELLRGFDPGLLTFFNVNTREDLKRARMICGR